MAYLDSIITKTYSGTGQQTEVIIPRGVSDSWLFSIKQDDVDVTDLYVRIHPKAQLVKIAELTGDFAGRLPVSCFSIVVNIDTNASGNIILDISPE